VSSSVLLAFLCGNCLLARRQPSTKTHDTSYNHWMLNVQDFFYSLSPHVLYDIHLSQSRVLSWGYWVMLNSTTLSLFRVIIDSCLHVRISILLFRRCKQLYQVGPPKFWSLNVFLYVNRWKNRIYSSNVQLTSNSETSNKNKNSRDRFFVFSLEFPSAPS